jgi:predicted transcriptional regulator of viral defense system
MVFFQAVFLSLGEITEPVITRYRLGLLLHALYANRQFQGEPLDGLTRKLPTRADFEFHLHELEHMGILKDHPNFPGKAFRLLGRKEENGEDVACTIDPFCYLSHLSAMTHHGLTNRLPVKLFVSSPAPSQWKAEAESRMRKDLGADYEAYHESGMPRLSRIKFTKIGRMDVHCFEASHRGAYINIRGRTLRVSSIGRTFLDMLRNPELCGGMRHVVEVFEAHAAIYLQLITEEVDRNGKPIDKVRAGYLLDEKLGLGNDMIGAWAAFAQRGGSRKLDASGPYVPVWSPKWCLSLNLDG